MVWLPGLLGGYSADVWVTDSNVRVFVLHIGVHVMAHDVLLAPHKGGRTDCIQRGAHEPRDPGHRAVGAMVGVVHDADPHLAHADAEQHGACNTGLQGCTGIKCTIVGCHDG